MAWRMSFWQGLRSAHSSALPPYWPAAKPPTTFPLGTPSFSLLPPAQASFPEDPPPRPEADILPGGSVKEKKQLREISSIALGWE